MGNKAKSRKKKAAARSREQRAARECAEERERYAEVIAARQARRRAAFAVATAFVKQHMPRPERIGTFCKGHLSGNSSTCPRVKNRSVTDL